MIQVVVCSNVLFLCARAAIRDPTKIEVCRGLPESCSWNQNRGFRRPVGAPPCNRALPPCKPFKPRPSNFTDRQKGKKFAQQASKKASRILPCTDQEEQIFCSSSEGEATAAVAARGSGGRGEALDPAAAARVALERPRPSCSGVQRGFGQPGQFQTLSSQHQQKGK